MCLRQSRRSDSHFAVVPIVPSRDWSLPHTPPDPREPGAEGERKPSLLGLSMRMCEPEFALDNVRHVLDVLEGSPAESAGLVPYGDWIIGWSGGVLSAEGDFYEVVEAVRPISSSEPLDLTSRCSISTSHFVCTCTHMTLSERHHPFCSDLFSCGAATFEK